MAAAELALSVLNLDLVRLIPCYLPNPDYKQTVTASPEQRLQMLTLATAAQPKLLIDELELQRRQTSYTIDTLTRLRSRFSEAALVFVLGMDSFNSLPGWHRWQELLELTHFLILSRPGYCMDPATASACGLDQRQVSGAAELFKSNAGKILLLESLAVDVSSSMLRGKISQGESLAGLIDDRVLEYIKVQGLYQNPAAY